jgi:fatty-acyl-CoA synthase
MNDHRLPPVTLGGALRSSAARHSVLPFILTKDRRLSFQEFDDEVDRFAAGLLGLGIGRGDHVALWLHNSIEWILVFCACARIGAVVVPVNTRYKRDEVRHVVANSNAKALVMLERMWGGDYYDMLVSMSPELAKLPPGSASSATFPALRHIVLLGDTAKPATVTFASMLAAGQNVTAVRVAEDRVRPDDLLLICYTSGTTGHPKGVMHNHGVLRQAIKVGNALRLMPGDRVMAHMPFYHVGGLFMGLVPCLALGAALVPLAHWDPKSALNIIESERINVFGGIATHFHDLLNDPTLDSRDTSSLQVAWIGGSPVTRATFESFRNRLKIGRLLSTYGMTENTVSTTFNRWDDPIELCCSNAAPILADCEVKLVDPITSSTVMAGEQGEIWCRGSTVMLGYYNDPAATRQAITAEGWLRTGDLGRFDQNGNLAVIGRLKDMLKVGGANVSPVEIEEILAEHPNIRSAVVVGAPNDRLSEVAYAFVQADSGASVSESDVILYCKQRLSDYKVPRFVEFVDDFPRTSTGKIQKSALSERARAAIQKKK